MSTDQKDNILDIENISNAEIKAKWGLPDDIDPYSVDIDKINPPIMIGLERILILMYLKD